MKSSRLCELVYATYSCKNDHFCGYAILTPSRACSWAEVRQYFTSNMDQWIKGPLKSPVKLWDTSNFDGSRLCSILNSDTDPAFYSALLLHVYLPFSPLPSPLPLPFYPSVPHRIFIDKNHTYGTFSSQLAGSIHPKRGIRPMGQCTTTKTSRTHQIYISRCIWGFSTGLEKKRHFPMLFFSAFDPSQPLIPAHLSLLLRLPKLMKAVPTRHYLLTSLVLGIRMQCLALILTTINSLLLMFVIIKDDSFW